MSSTNNINRHAKFAGYWGSIGRPQLICWNKASPSPVWKSIVNPTWAEFCEYRIEGDVHWELRRQWVDSDKKLPIQFWDDTLQYSQLKWLNCRSNYPTWHPAIQYRAAPVTTTLTSKAEELEQEKQMSGTEQEWDALIHKINTAEPGELVEVTEAQLKKLREEPSAIRWDNVLLKLPSIATMGRQAAAAALAKRSEQIMLGVASTLAERGNNYGSFNEVAKTAQILKQVCASRSSKLEPIHAEALANIMQKVARILNGDPNYVDSWHDIQGYAKLVEDYILEQQQERDSAR